VPCVLNKRPAGIPIIPLNRPEYSRSAKYLLAQIGESHGVVMPVRLRIALFKIRQSGFLKNTSKRAVNVAFGAVRHLNKL
jgi:hypothetical protein